MISKESDLKKVELIRSSHYELELLLTYLLFLFEKDALSLSIVTREQNVQKIGIFNSFQFMQIFVICPQAVNKAHISFIDNYGFLAEDKRIFSWRIDLGLELSFEDERGDQH